MSVATPIERWIWTEQKRDNSRKFLVRKTILQNLAPSLPLPTTIWATFPRPPIIFRDVAKAHTGKTWLNSKNNNNALTHATYTQLHNEQAVVTWIISTKRTTATLLHRYKVRKKKHHLITREQMTSAVCRCKKWKTSTTSATTTNTAQNTKIGICVSFWRCYNDRDGVYGVSW